MGDELNLVIKIQRSTAGFQTVPVMPRLATTFPPSYANAASRALECRFESFFFSVQMRVRLDLFSHSPIHDLSQLQGIVKGCPSDA